MIPLNIEPGTTYHLAVMGQAPSQVHVFEATAIDAINAAIAAKRPLLVRGEPGTGKTQLARAAAKALDWAFVSCTIDSRSEAAGLLYHLDAVTRLGEAQIIGALPKREEKDVRELLAEKRFIHPGPLWWAFNWQSAQAQAELVGMAPPHQPDAGKPDQGCVLLIDEIDKADADLPNGLLAAFGDGCFQPPGIEEPVERSDKPLLVVITTNEERALPDAFLRRCLVLHLKFPEGEALERFFIDRGKAHFPQAAPDVLSLAAEQVRIDREHCQQMGLAAPGLAEFLDLIRAVIEQEKSTETQKQLLRRIKKFVLKKHPEV